ncbi:MAG TPA: hypothetical protein VKM93_22820 [Terriglobia bacterium]|nr:hypothetical protein [Terriglobia bacterium]
MPQVARASRRLWRERLAPAPGIENWGRPGLETRDYIARAEPALSEAKGCPAHIGRDARATEHFQFRVSNMQFPIPSFDPQGVIHFSQ